MLNLPPPPDHFLVGEFFPGVFEKRGKGALVWLGGRVGSWERVAKVQETRDKQLRASIGAGSMGKKERGRDPIAFSATTTAAAYGVLLPSKAGGKKIFTAANEGLAIPLFSTVHLIHW